MTRRILLLCMLVSLGCSTATQFRLPPDSTLFIKNRKFVAEKNGYADVRVSPFFWTGISYKLMQKNKIVQEGKLNSSFRPAALFWPPGAIFYWPKGFGAECYDLTVPSKGAPPACVNPERATGKPREFDSGQPWMSQ